MLFSWYSLFNITWPLLIKASLKFFGNIFYIPQSSDSNLDRSSLNIYCSVMLNSNYIWYRTCRLAESAVISITEVCILFFLHKFGVSSHWRWPFFFKNAKKNKHFSIWLHFERKTSTKNIWKDIRNIMFACSKKRAYVWICVCSRLAWNNLHSILATPLCLALDCHFSFFIITKKSRGSDFFRVALYPTSSSLKALAGIVAPLINAGCKILLIMTISDVISS